MRHIQQLMDEGKCYDEIRRERWPYGPCCPHCTSNKVVKRGRHHRQPECRRYGCRKCGKRFDDLTGTVFAGRHRPLRVWIAYLYLMGLNLSNRQIAQEPGLDESDGQHMAEALRGRVAKRRPKVYLQGVVECDEVYVVAGHKGRPDKIEGRKPRRNRLKGARGRGTLAKEKPPIFGMIERGGAVRIVMLENVQQDTIRPYVKETVLPGTPINTDEYAIYGALPSWGYRHKTVCHGRGEYARDEACPELVEGTATASMRSMSIPWGVFGRCCVRGYARTGVFPKKNCRPISASLSLCIMSGAAGGLCWAPSWAFFCSLKHVLKTQYEPLLFSVRH